MGNDILAACSAGMFIFGIAVLFFFTGISYGTDYLEVMRNIRGDIDSKMHRLKLDYYDTHTHGDILSVITNDVDAINNTASQNLTSIVTQVVQAFSYQDRANKRFQELNEELKNSSYKAGTTAGAVSPITTMVNDMGYVVCAAIGCISAIGGLITVGNVQVACWRTCEK